MLSRESSGYWRIYTRYLVFCVALILGLALILQSPGNVNAVTPPTPTAEAKPESLVLFLPWRGDAEFYVTQTYGADVGVGTHQNSDAYALDFGMPIGTDIYPVLSGTVSSVNTDATKDYGKYIIVTHSNGYRSLYAHLNETFVITNEVVSLSTIIGRSGKTGKKSTGAHLHLRITRGNIPVVPEPIIGYEAYEGFGLRWIKDGISHKQWLGRVKAITPPTIDAVPGNPNGQWGNETTPNNAQIAPGQEVKFVASNLSADTKEVRFTVFYPDWSLMDNTLDQKVWRILARCWPGRQSTGCEWNGTSSVTYRWQPHNDNLQSAAPWLPSGPGYVNKAYNDVAQTSSPTTICISFDVFDLSGNVSYAPNGTQCSITSPSNMLLEANDVFALDNQSRQLYVQAAQPSIVDSYWWLIELAKWETPPLEVNLRATVKWDSSYDAMRLCIDGTNCQETSATQVNYIWNTYGWSDGYHTLSVQYRRKSDNGDWNTAYSYSEQFFLSPNRNGIAPCDGGNGAYLRSGSDCIRLTQSNRELSEVNWSDRSNMTVSVLGPYEAWVFDDPDYQGTSRLVRSGEEQGVGSNVSSVRLDPASPPPPPPPSSPFTCDPNTVSLYHFDEGIGSNIIDACGRVNGIKDGSANWGAGRFSFGIVNPNTQDGRTVNLGATSTHNFCPLTFETWIKNSGTGNGRIAGQQGGGGNTGSNKWLLSLDNNQKPRIEIWSGGGSQGASSYKAIGDNLWHYLMFTFDCQYTGKLYLDNELVASVTTAGNWPSGNTTFEIGSTEGIYRFYGSFDEARLSNVVRVPTWEAPKANFSATPTIGPAPLVVNFSDTSTGPITSWLWNFGDGTTSTEESPSHYFNAPGTYNVSLTVIGPGGSNTKTYVGLVTVMSQPTPTATSTPTPTASRTASPSATFTSTATRTTTPSKTLTRTLTATSSATSTPTPSVTITATSTKPITWTPTSMPSLTATPTYTRTPTITRTATRTNTLTATSTPSKTSTRTPTATAFAGNFRVYIPVITR